MKGKLIEATVEFKVDGNLIEFKVIHNMPNTKGLSFNDAFESWIIRTKKYTAKSLCKYILSKNDSVVAMTEKQYKRLFQ